MYVEKSDFLKHLRKILPLQKSLRKNVISFVEILNVTLQIGIIFGLINRVKNIDLHSNQRKWSVFTSKHLQVWLTPMSESTYVNVRKHCMLCSVKPYVIFHSQKSPFKQMLKKLAKKEWLKNSLTSHIREKVRWKHKGIVKN